MKEECDSNPLVKAVLRVLEKYTTLAFPVFLTQCTRASLRPESLELKDVETLAPLISAAVARFTSPQTGEKLRRDLLSIDLRESTPSSLHLPDGRNVGGFTQEVLKVIGRFTPFAWPILETQCLRAKQDPSELTPGKLLDLVDSISFSVARWTSPEKGDAVKERLNALAGARDRESPKPK